MTTLGESIGKSFNIKSTVRGRKKKAEVSTQRFLPIAEIHTDTVFLKNGGIRAVLEAQALNYNLKSETEQKGIIAGYGAFVNTVTFPIQIVVRSVKTDIDAYLDGIRKQAETHENALLKDQTLSYADFVEKIIDVADIMEKKFYIIVPLDHAARKKKTLLESFFGWMSSDDSTSRANQRSHEFMRANAQLQERIELVRAGLSNIGIPSHRLTTKELIVLFYQIYNPITSKLQKLPEDQGLLQIEKTTL